jgi:hypothetical protein
MVKRWDCWRWWWGENHCVVTDPCDSNTEYWRTFCLSSVLIVLPSYPGEKEGGQERDGQRHTVDSCGWIPGPSKTYI